MRYCEGSMIAVLVFRAGGGRVSEESGSRLKRCFSLLATRVCSSVNVTCMDARRRQRSWGGVVRTLDDNCRDISWGKSESLLVF